jgi:hypothetical protein
MDQACGMRRAQSGDMSTSAAVSANELPVDIIPESGHRAGRRLLFVVVAAIALVAAGLVGWSRLRPRTNVPVKLETAQIVRGISRRA